jgi:hypothetical protein
MIILTSINLLKTCQDLEKQAFLHLIYTQITIFGQNCRKYFSFIGWKVAKLY